MSEQSWSELCGRLAARGDQTRIYRDLEQLYREPHRAYHNLDHILNCISELRTDVQKTAFQRIKQDSFLHRDGTLREKGDEESWVVARDQDLSAPMRISGAIK